MANVTKGGGTAVMDPNLFEADAGLGMENLGQEDLSLPFLKIVESNSPILKSDDNVKLGNIFNSATNRVYGNGIKVVPCAYQRRFLEWKPRGQGSGAPENIYKPEDQRPVVKRDKNDNKDYVVDGDGSYIEETHQHFVIIINEDGSRETALIAMKSTQLKKSRKWNSMISTTMIKGKNGPFQAPRCSHIYDIKTVSEDNSKGSWYGWEVSREGPIQDANLYSQCKAFAQSVMEGDVVVKHQDDSESEKSDNIPF